MADGLVCESPGIFRAQSSLEVHTEWREKQKTSGEHQSLSALLIRRSEKNGQTGKRLQKDHNKTSEDHIGLQSEVAGTILLKPNS